MEDFTLYEDETARMLWEHHHHQESEFDYVSNDAYGDAEGDYYSWAPHHLVQRLLAKKKVELDYSVLSVSVLTLGLIMFVELGCHMLNHSAEHRPFFKAVLEGVYAELAILGIVEFAVFLMQTYYPEYDKAKKDVFGKVHFALFYTAVFNALQTALMARVSFAVAKKMWVQTETLELNHYVEIREEYERVQEKLDLLTNRVQTSNSSSKSSGGGDHTGAESSDDDNNDGNNNDNSAVGGNSTRAEPALELNQDSVGRLWRTVSDRIRYPHLKAKRDQLLVQVRFHELRLYFLQAHKLPLKLKVSDYLMSSLLHVLLHMVHISTVAWLVLTAGVSLLYFIMGVVAYHTADVNVVGTSMIWIYFWLMAGFNLIAFAVYNKMKLIFGNIMNQKVLWDIVDCEEEKKKLAAEQLNMFWFGDPHLVMAALQSMQFAYAVALSCLIIFFGAIDDGSVAVGYYYLMFFVCYGIFVTVVANVIPRYTLCTSLGQLVDMSRLHETKALFHLEQVKLERMQMMESKKFYHDHPSMIVRSNSHGSLGTLQEHQSHSDSNLSKSGGSVGGSKYVPSTTLAESERALLSSGSNGGPPSLGSFLARSGSGSVRNNFDNDEEGSKQSSQQHSVAEDSTAMIGRLVRMDTMRLRTELPESEREKLSQRDVARQNRRAARRKSVSDGVAAMARAHKQQQQQQQQAQGSNVSLQVDALVGKSATRHGNRKKSLSSGPSDPSTTYSLQVDALVGRSTQRKTWKRSLSGGVAAMAAMTDAPPDAPKSSPEDLRRDAAKARAAAAKTSKSASSSASNAKKAPLADHQIAAAAARKHHLDDDDDRDSDAPVVDPDMQELAHDIAVHHYAPKTLKQRIRDYYLSKKYVVLSNVFGTMVAFYYVGQRVERFIDTEAVYYSPYFVSFAWNNTVTFWLLTGWFVMFLGQALLIFWAFGPFDELKTKKERRVVVAAAIDFVIVAVCLTVFFVAETQRCCYHDGGSANASASDAYRYLAEEEKGDKGGYDEVNGFAADEGGDKGGDKGGYGDDKGAATASDKGEDKGGYGDKGGKGAAYAAPPEPAECDCPAFGSRLYGGLGTIEPYVALFVLRLLRHLLAKQLLKWLESKQNMSRSKTGGSMGAGQDLSGRWNADNDPFDFDEHHGDDHNGHGDGHGHGHGGGHGDGHGHGHGGPEKGTVAELWESAVGQHPEIVSKYGEFSGELLKAMLGVPIELAAKAPSHDELAIQSKDQVPCPMPAVDNSSMFTAPSARLVRSMRRCDRKLLPMLEHWTVVDVVMTRFEMVYFDASDVDNTPLDEDTKAIRQSIVATKGGKGLRLSDVAVGRRVVGIALLTDVASVHVERELPGNNNGTTRSDDGPEEEVGKSEYWREKEDIDHFDHKSKWPTIKQDCLRIEDKDGPVLYLRFYGDLQEALDHPERMANDDEEAGEIFKTHAFCYVQTIGRYCGPEQLKQPLPHFGQDNSDELRDYLTMNNGGDGHHHHHGRQRRGMLAGFRQNSEEDLGISRHAVRRTTARPQRKPKPIEPTSSPAAVDVGVVLKHGADGGETGNNNNKSHQQKKSMMSALSSDDEDDDVSQSGAAGESNLPSWLPPKAKFHNQADSSSDSDDEEVVDFEQAV